MKKVFSCLVLATAIIPLVLAACGGGSVEKATPTATSTPTAAGVISELIQKARVIRNITCDFIVTQPGGKTITAKEWAKLGETWKFRIELTQEGQTQIVIFLGEWAYMYNPGNNTALKLARGASPNTQQQSPVEQSISVLEQINPTAVGNDTVDGKSCYVYEVKTEGSSVRCWVWKDYGVIIKNEATTPQGKVVVEFKNISWSEIPDSVFQLPPGVEII